MPVVRSSGLSIHYLDRGEGEPVLLLNGLGCATAGWGPLLPALAGARRCLAVDARGSGASEVPARGFAVADMADDARAVLDAAGVERAHVVGNSLGGMVAQTLAHRHPHRVRSLVLAASSPGVVSVPSHPSLAWHLLRATRSTGERRARHLAAALHGPLTTVDHPERLRPTGRPADDTALPSGPGARLQLRAAMRWSSLWRLRSLRVPTLVLHGTHDRLVPAANARLLARLVPGARLALLARAGHFLITDAADEMAEAVNGFLAVVERAAPRMAARSVGTLATEAAESVAAALRQLTPLPAPTSAI